MDKALLSAALLAIASANPDGFTVDAKTLQGVSSGYAVAVADTQDSFGSDGLSRVIDYVNNHSNVNAFGGWYNNENGLFYWDATVICYDLAEALELARANKQIAIFDLNTLTEIKVNY